MPFISMPPKSTDRTAIVVHGYKVRAEGMLHIAYLSNHDMGYNVLLPDLYGHGESEGDHIQMGWNDRWDVIRWSQVAHEIFKVKSKERRVKNTWQVIPVCGTSLPLSSKTSLACQLSL